MKRLLNIIGAVGLVASTSCNVIACNKKDDRLSIDAHGNTMDINLKIDSSIFEYWDEYITFCEHNNSYDSVSMNFWNAYQILLFVNLSSDEYGDDDDIMQFQNSYDDEDFIPAMDNWSENESINKFVASHLDYDYHVEHRDDPIKFQFDDKWSLEVNKWNNEIFGESGVFQIVWQYYFTDDGNEIPHLQDGITKEQIWNEVSSKLLTDYKAKKFDTNLSGTIKLEYQSKTVNLNLDLNLSI